VDRKEDSEMLLLLLACRSIEINEITGKDVENTDTGTSEETINIEDVHLHLDMFQQLADENSNNRAVGTPGSIASISYVKDILTEAGYTVWTQDVSLELYQENEDPFFIIDGSQEFDASGFYYSPSGEVTAQIQAVDLKIPPGNQANSSNSGCDDADFSDFVPGRIALLQRGTCQFVDKAQRAEDAGAVGVIIFNEGQQGRQDVLTGTLAGNTLSIPVLGTSYSWGQQLAERDGETVTINIDAEVVELSTQNVFAEREVGDENAVLLIGGHLDSVYAGPGINDNGSGSASLLSLAQKLARESYESQNRIRFAFWGAEEIGLIGSSYYVENASDTELNSIIANLNFDMLASPNYARFIYDGDGSDTSQSGPNGSDVIEGLFEDYFRSKELSFTSTAFDGRSDYGPFIAVGIPAGGLFSGAEGVKEYEESLIFGGDEGVEYDRCYHLVCDDRSNINDQGLEEMYRAIISVAKSMANLENFPNRRIHKDLPIEKKKYDYWGDILQR
jgi:Zn-dependent M28 family amino/carboxypeptidase